jgi:hypothetical protein
MYKLLSRYAALHVFLTWFSPSFHLVGLPLPSGLGWGVPVRRIHRHLWYYFRVRTKQLVGVTRFLQGFLFSLVVACTVAAGSVSLWAGAASGVAAAAVYGLIVASLWRKILRRKKARTVLGALSGAGG